jgi:type I restriction enzyme S subunit
MPIKEGKHTLGPNMFLLRLNQNTEFFIHQLNSPFCSEQLKIMAVSSAQPKLNKDNIRQLKVVSPPLEEQNDISIFITNETNKVQLTIDSAYKAIELLKEYKTALISEVVTGKVDVRNEKLN